MMTNSITTVQSGRKRLYEISLIRPIVILSLVLNHVFDKIAAGGLRSNDYVLPDVYRWLNYFNFEATLEIFVLISGYLFGYQCITLNRSDSLLSFAQKKVHRLLLPMLVFGVIYYFCFFYSTETFTISDLLNKVLSGCGHLWFLPMLFWCLLVLWVLNRLQINETLTFVCLALLSMIKYVSLPFGLAQISHYLFYAFLGYYIYKHKDSINACLKKRWLVPTLWVLYIIFVWVLHLTILTTLVSSNCLASWWGRFLTGVVELSACISGIMAIYSIIISYTSVQGFELHLFVSKADKMSFGIYIYHQFILVALYHYTPIVSLVNSWILPWIGLAIALPVSWLLTSSTLQTKTGRYLIG